MIMSFEGDGWGAPCGPWGPFFHLSKGFHCRFRDYEAISIGLSKVTADDSCLLLKKRHVELSNRDSGRQKVMVK